jgi:transposase
LRFAARCRHFLEGDAGVDGADDVLCSSACCVTAAKLTFRDRTIKAAGLSSRSELRICAEHGDGRCGTAYHWAREISKLGHTVRLMPPSYVKGYVKRSKNDAADAAAICEAVTRPSMRFAPIKSADQQALLMLHRTRDPC